MDTFSQGLLLAMSTARTVLTRIGRIDRYKRPTGTCCLVREERSELGPRCIVNTFGEAMIVHHLIDRQVFHRNDVEVIDHATARLMGKVAPSVRNTLMHSADDLATLTPLWRAFRGSRKLPLCAV